jgi:ferric-dicitrate binding protein FerR (iron transport regulator)
MTDFEQRLWDHLANEFNADDINMPIARTIVSQSPQRRRRVTITAGLTAAAAAVVVAVVLIISATTATPPAYLGSTGPRNSVQVRSRVVTSVTSG